VQDLYCGQVRDYGQYCPVSLGSEVLADRWTPLILREMVLGSTRFNDIERGLPGISRSLLAQRLTHLERKGAVERRPAAAGRGSEYHLTPAGRALEPVLTALGEWAIEWMFTQPEPEVVDPVTLTWWMHRRIATDRLPDRRVVVEFDYRGDDAMIIWIVLDRGEASVCMKPPGFDTDVLVVTDAVAMMRVFSGIETLAEAREAGTIVVEAVPALRNAFGDWFLGSPFSAAVRARVTR
jgi:DNA-binding HxlR family transcriptional regulator